MLDNGGEDVSSPDLPFEGYPVELTSRQRELYLSLMDLDEELAGLFRIGLFVAEQGSAPGAAITLAHLGRELTLGVVDVSEAGDARGSQRTSQPIPEDETHRHKIARNLALPPGDERVSQWFDLHRLMSAAAHHRRGARPAEFELVERGFGHLEQLLFGLVGPYFSTQDALDELLALSSPTDKDVATLNSLLVRPQQRRYFYSRLEQAAWLTPLRDSGAFDHPPERQIDEDGRWRAVTWVEGEYLARMAAHEPHLVAEALLAVPTSIENPLVWSVVAKAAVNLPVKSGRKLAERVVKGSTLFPGIILDEMLGLANRLSEAGEAVAIRIVEMLLFMPSPDRVPEQSEFSSATDWLFPRLGWHGLRGDVGKTIRALAAGDHPLDTLAMLVGRVDRAVRLFKKLDRPRLAESQLRSTDSDADRRDAFGELTRLLTECLRLTAGKSADLIQKAWELVDGLDETSSRIVSLHLLATAPQYSGSQVDDFLTSEETLEPWPWGRYVAAALRACFEHGSDQARQAFIRALRAGPSSESLEPKKKADESQADEGGDRAAWQRTRLTWFRGNVPSDLVELAETVGLGTDKPTVRDQELAEVGFYSGGVSWGAPSDYAVADLEAMDFANLIELLLTWEPAPEDVSRGTERGMQESIRSLSTARRDLAIRIAEEVGDVLRPGFLRALVDGLRDAIGDADGANVGAAIASVTVEALGRAVPDLQRSKLEQRYLLRSCLETIEHLATRNMIGADAESTLRDSVAEGLASGAELDESPRAYSTLDEILTASLNTLVPVAYRVTVLVELAIFRRREAGNEGRDEAHAGVIGRLLRDLDERSGSLRLLCESVVGRLLPQLLLLAPDISEDRLAELLDGGASSILDKPAWATYVTRSTFYNDALAPLLAWYRRAAREVRSIDAGSYDRFSPAEGLLSHLTIALLRGLVPVDDPAIHDAFTNSQVSDVGRAYWRIYRGWNDAEEPPPTEFVSRLVALWEWRLEALAAHTDEGRRQSEANELSWLVLTPHVPDHRATPLVQRTSELARGDLELHFGWERVASLTRSAPDVMSSVVEGYVLSQLSKRDRFLQVREVRPLIEILLDQGGAETRRIAQRIVHRLGEAGHDDMRDLV